MVLFDTDHKDFKASELRNKYGCRIISKLRDSNAQGCVRMGIIYETLPKKTCKATL